MSVRVLKSVRFSNSAAAIVFGAAALFFLGAGFRQRRIAE